MIMDMWDVISEMGFVKELYSPCVHKVTCIICRITVKVEAQ